MENPNDSKQNDSFGDTQGIIAPFLPEITSDVNADFSENRDDSANSFPADLQSYKAVNHPVVIESCGSWSKVLDPTSGLLYFCNNDGKFVF